MACSSAWLSLTSFETILLDCKKTSKLVNFCVAILILKMKEETQHFQHIMFYYFKKGKNTTEMQKICAVYEEVAEMIEHVKSGL